MPEKPISSAMLGLGAERDLNEIRQREGNGDGDLRYASRASCKGSWRHSGQCKQVRGSHPELPAEWTQANAQKLHLFKELLVVPEVVQERCRKTVKGEFSSMGSGAPSSPSNTTPGLRGWRSRFKMRNSSARAPRSILPLMIGSGGSSPP